MARDYYINGETLVLVKGGNGSGLQNLSELGLSVDQIRVVPRYHHMDIHTDDYGLEVPAEVLWMLSDAVIIMTLVHFDYSILKQVMLESMAGIVGESEGKMGGAGTPLGAGQTIASTGVFSQKFRYISLNLRTGNPGNAGDPPEHWRFPTSYLFETPIEFPLGTEKSAIKLKWRAIPYGIEQGGEVVSRSVSLWDHTLDT